jgi:hypothetical protein
MTMRKMLLAAPLLLAPGLAEAQSSYNPNLVRGVYIAAGAGVNWLNDTPIAATGQLADSLALSGRSLSGDVRASRVIWGDLSALNIAPKPLSWGNLERANGDLVTK